MRLIRVAAMLDIEARIHQGKEVNTTTEIFGEFYGPALTAKQYAILSHCWGVWERDEREVSFKEMNKLLVKGEVKRDEIRGRTGYKKIIDTCRQAQKDELEWVWIDTCCINKDSSSELSEAINSMYKWYAQAKLCYTYLHDTVGNSWTNREEWRSTPKWFSRGWTLQELIAPKVVHFFDREWKWIGNKAELANALSRITGIPQRVLNEGLQKASSSEDDFERPSVAQIISWAARRTTTREEDRAYSLLGLLGVHMPMLYGEGKNAFRRLQLEIIRTSNDQSIFAWGFRTRQSGWSSSVLADDPSCFVDCRQIIVRRSEQLTEHLRKNGMPDEELSKFTQKRLHTFTVTNGGIQIWLPTVTAGLFSKVKLACCESNWDFITIDLVFRDSTCFRTFNLPKPPGQIEFKQHLLPYKEAEYPSTFTFKLQDQKLSQGGFVLDCVYPEEGEVEVEDGLVTLSSDYDFAALAYVRGNDATCFYVLLSYFAGGHSAFALLHPENFVYSPVTLRPLALKRLFNSKHEPRHDHDTHLLQHIHFPGSIEGIRVVHGVPYDSSADCTVAIDITKCSGCCTHEESLIPDLVETPRTPGMMWDCFSCIGPRTWQNLSENDADIQADIPLCLNESELKPGDFGRVPQYGEGFRPEGNISEFATGVGLAPIQDDVRGIHCPELGTVESTVSFPGGRPENWALTFLRLNLYDGTSWSLPANQQVVSLLNALSFRLSDRLLVTRVIRCSDRCHLRPRLYSTRTLTGTLDPDAWQTLDTPTPLSSVMMPLSWRPTEDEELMTMLRKIINNFSVLIGWVDPLDDPKHSTGSVTVETAVGFFVDMFGGGNIRNFIGKILFFRELPVTTGTENNTELDIAMDNGCYPTLDISEGEEVTEMVQAQSINPLVEFLVEIGDGTFDLQLSPENDVQVGSQRIGWTKLWKNALGWRSSPLAVKVLKLIATEYQDAGDQDDKFDRKVYDVSLTQRHTPMTFSRREFLSEVEEIKQWQETLNRSNDVHERRTLVEDIVGKILLACWRGVKSEIVQVLRKVVDRYVNNEAVGHTQWGRTDRLSKIGGVFWQAIHHIPEDLNPLRRIMDDALHRVSKHQLLLSERDKLAALSNEDRHTLKRKRETSVSAEPSSPVKVQR